MNVPHVIRLRGPWDYQPLSRTVLQADGTSIEEPGSLPPSGVQKLPADWATTLGADFRGRVRYVRRFGSPTNLESSDRVLLVLSAVDAWADVSINGVPLGRVRHGESPPNWDVTRILSARNELTVDVELPREEPNGPRLPRPDPNRAAGGLIGEVRLEIHTGAGSRFHVKA